MRLHQEKSKSPTEAERQGFTMLEVTLVLALTGLLLIGLLGGTAAAIQTQRYNDSVRSYAESG